MTERLLRIVRYRPRVPGAVADGHLRDVVVPAMTSLPGFALCFVARRGTDPDASRIVVSLWEAEGDLPRAATMVDPAHVIEGHPDHEELVAEVLPVIVDFRAPSSGEPTVLRMFHGRVRPGELEVYAREANAGAAADVEAGYGPLAFFLAADPPDRFVTVSAWTDWTTVERATGGDIRNPFATKFSARLLEWTVDHFELVPAARNGARAEIRTAPQTLLSN